MKIIISLISLLIFSYPVLANEVRYSYVSFPSESGFVDVFHIIGSNSLIQGDVGSKVTDCSNSELYCSQSKLFTFALPLKLKDQTLSWHVDGIDFNYEQDSLILFREDKYPVMIINSSDGNTFYYSNTYGLLALKVCIDDKCNLYLLSSSYGLFKQNQ